MPGPRAGGSQFLNSRAHRALHGLSVRRGRAVRRRALSDRGRPRPPRHHGQVVGRLRRDGRADAAARRCSAASPRTAGDALFEVCLPAGVPSTRHACCAIASRARSPSCTSGCPRRRASTTRRSAPPMEMYGYACAYSPDPERPGEALLPVRCHHRPARRGGVGALARRRTRCGWSAATPTRCVDAPHPPRRRAAATSTTWTSVRRRSPRADSALDIEHTLELFDGTHGGISYRYPGAIRELVRALA